ncbi:MAG: RluA family pseudouridine synthase [Bdellovibrionota bacterium]
MNQQSQALTQDSYSVSHLVDHACSGLRLDAFLKSKYARRSREQLKHAIDDGSVILKRNQGSHYQLGRLKPSIQLLPGDEVLVVSKRKTEPDVSFDYKVIFEDESILVINKPANLPVHPAGRFFFNTLLVHLQTHGGNFFLAHRIDKETSGILVLAKNKEACAELVSQFAGRTTFKRYLAIACGITPESFIIDAAIKRDINSKISVKMMTTPESDGSMPAVTSFTRISKHGEFSLLECLPKTGRQHQIRVHLEHAGYPIVGDKLYGHTDRLLLPRHALHATAIRFKHPATHMELEFTSELPEDLKNFLSSISAAHATYHQ